MVWCIPIPVEHLLAIPFDSFEMDRIQFRSDKAKQFNAPPSKWNPKRALFPLFPTARYVGVYPCDSKWAPTSKWMKYSKWILLVPILCDVYQLVYGIATPDEVMKVAMINIVLHEVRATCELISVSGYLYTLLRSSEILKNLCDHLKNRTPRRKEFFFCARFLACVIIGFFFFGTVVLNWKSVWTKTIGRRIMITGLSVTNSYVTFLTIMYCSMMEIFTSDFSRLNSLVENGADLKSAVHQHRYLNDLCNKGGRLFSLHLFGHCSKIATTIVQNVHLCIQNVLLPRTELTITFASLSGLQASNEFLYLYFITTYSERVHSESLRFYRTLSKRVMRYRKYYTDRELTTYLSLKRTVKLTAAGFFELNRPVFTSVLGGCITYIVIVIQLSRTGE